MTSTNSAPTQPSEAHRKLWQEMFRLSHVDDMDKHVEALKLIDESEVRATEKLRTELTAINDALGCHETYAGKSLSESVALLRAENERLTEDLRKKSATLEGLRNYRGALLATAEADCDSLRQQLSASQEREKRLREAGLEAVSLFECMVESYDYLSGGVAGREQQREDRKIVAALRVRLSTPPTETYPNKET